MPIKVIINGYQGKMGRVTKQAIADQADLELVATTGSADNLSQAIKTHHADVVIDFTTPASVYHNVTTIINSGARPVVGTTGLSLEQINELQQRCLQKSLGGIIAPNFSIGGVLMMRYAQDAAKYLPHVEIIEMHHPFKLDAPSGTAKKTAEMIAATKKKIQTKNKEVDALSRGEKYHDIPVHSVRLPGLFAHQVVIFGGEGETFTLRHDSMDRQCMMPGVFMACRKVMELDHLIYGLENVL